MSVWSFILENLPGGSPPTKKKLAVKSPLATVSVPVVSNLTEATSVADCLKLYTSSQSGSSLEKSAEDKLRKIIRDFDGWMEVREAVSPTSSLGIYAWNQLMLFAKTFEHWQQICHVCHDENVRTTALEKMATMAKSLEEKLHVYGVAPEGGVIKAQMFASLRSETKTTDEWLEVLDEAGDEALQKVAVEMAMATTPTDKPAALARLLDNSTIADDDGLTNSILAKLRAITPDVYDDWKDFYGDTENDQAKTIARDKLVEGINSFERLEEVDDLFEDNQDEYDEDETFSAAYETKAKLMLSSEKICRSIVSNYYADSRFFRIAFGYLLSQAENTRQCLDLYQSALDDWHTEGDEADDDRLEEATTKLLAVATPTELYILSKLDEDNFGELGEKAQEKLEEISAS